MNTSFIQRSMSVLFASLLASVTVIGCQAGVTDESVPDDEVAETDQALLNCKGQCAQAYMTCMKSTDDYYGCDADRDACMADCDEKTCEPGDPGCCQEGQSSCW